jgi:hypothetical protein
VENFDSYPFAITALKQRGKTQFCILSESSATRKLWQKSRWVLVNAVTMQVDFKVPVTRRRVENRAEIAVML